MPPTAIAVETFPNPRYELVLLTDIARGDNPRKTFEPEAMAELTASVKAKGVEVPLILRPNPVSGGKKYQLVAGERRLRAAEAAGLKAVKAEIRFDLDNDRAAFETSLVENMQRQDLNPLDEGEAYKTLHVTHKVSVDDIAKKFGKKPDVIYNRLKLAELKGKARKLVASGELGAQIGVEVARLPSEMLQDRAVAQFEKHYGGLANLGHRDAEHILDQGFRHNLAKAPFDLKDAKLVPKAGACETCPKRAKNTCYDPECYQQKAELGIDAKQLAEAEKALAKGLEVLPPEESAAALEQARYGGKLVDLNEENYRDPKGRKWKNILGDKVTPVVAVDDEGQSHELVPVEQVKEALKAAGKGDLAPGAQYERSDDTKRHEAAQKKRRAVVNFVMPKLLEKAAKADSTPFFRVLARLAIKAAGSETLRELAKTRDFEKSGYESMKPLLATVDKLNSGECVALVLETFIAGGAAGWVHGTSGYGDSFKAAAEVLGFDLKKAEADMKAAEEKAEREAEAAKKAKAAEKEKKPEPKKEAPAKKSDPGVNAKTGKPRRMAIQEA